MVEANNLSLANRIGCPFDLEASTDYLTSRAGRAAKGAASLRAMGESDPERRNSVWQVMGQHEERLLGQLTQLQDELAKDQGGAWRASTLPLSLPLAVHWLPGASIDLRALLRVHTQGVISGADHERDDDDGDVDVD